MPQIPIIMPQLGESIAEATVVRLIAGAGESVRVDQELIEVETSKATSTVSSPCSGRIASYSIALQESYPVGAVLGYVEASEDEAREAGDARNESASDVRPAGGRTAAPRPPVSTA